MNFDVIIPIRSKSKGLKDKNIMNFTNDDHLTNHLLKKIINIKKINKIYVITDSNYYKHRILKNNKIYTSFKRPKKHSADNSKINDLIDYFLKKEIDISNNILLMQVTSPLLSKNEIVRTLKFIEKSKYQSLMHVCKSFESPYEMIKNKGKNWKYLMKKKILNRQNYKYQFYFITGSLYYFTKKFFKKNKSTYDHSSYAYEIDKINFVDIDDRLSFEIAKKLYKLKKRN